MMKTTTNEIKCAKESRVRQCQTVSNFMLLLKYEEGNLSLF